MSQIKPERYRGDGRLLSRVQLITTCGWPVIPSHAKALLRYREVVVVLREIGKPQFVYRVFLRRLFAIVLVRGESALRLGRCRGLARV